MERGVNMPSIMPISDLRNYTEVLKEVDKKNVFILPETVMEHMQS